MKKMAERKEIRKYFFTVEGETEKWYLEWLRDRVNESPDAAFRVSISAEVNQSPGKYAKRANPIATPKVTHLCDYESNEDVHVTKFHGILSQLKDANRIKGRRFKYMLGYSNFSFELWMVLHKQNCNGELAHRSQYLPHINRAFGEHFENLDQYKHEANFKRCLASLTLADVRAAINRANRIMQNNKDSGKQLMEYKGFRYYQDNPSLTIWEPIEQILADCKLL